MGRWLAAGLLLVAPVVRAQPNPPPAEIGPDGQVRSAPPTIVVIADVEPFEAANAKLRAWFYEQARSAGFEAAAATNVDAVAREQKALDDGHVTTDPARLEHLRRALGATVLLRVAKLSESEGKRSVQLIQVSEGGSEAREVEVNEATRYGPARQAAEEMWAAVLASHQPEQVEPPGESALRDAWAERSGPRPTFGLHLLATWQQIADVPHSEVNPATGANASGTANANGVGGGIGFRAGLSFLARLDPTAGGRPVPGFRVTTGLDSNFLYHRQPVGFDFSTHSAETRYEALGLCVLNVPFQVGFNLGFGEFRTEGTWRGAIVGLAYSPTLQAQFDLKTSESDVRFNPAGAELTVDIVTLKSGTDALVDGQIRFTVLGLPPIDEERPGLVSGALGFVLY